jgi:N-acetylglucosamine kinase-like BadF-type ATPase
MILIADSGATKTDWRLIDENKKIHQFATQGSNPYFQTSEQISEIIKVELLTQQFETHTVHFVADMQYKITSIFFYGAGCSAEDKKQVVKSALAENFPHAVIEVQSDMLGAARSLCGTNPGIAAILGTGANTCYYDGKNIVENKFSSGFILGDEGSGAHIGKSFIQAYLNDELPKDLTDRFISRYNLTKNDIIDAVYRKPMPNRFLASFSKFVFQNLKDQSMVDLVVGCFNPFFDRYICRYEKHKEVKLNCTGSVAFYYSNILRAIAAEKGVTTDIITETPIAGLTLYHLETL